MADLPSQETPERIPSEWALRLLAEHRRDDQVVVTNQMSARIWPTLSNHGLDFNYNPSNMGAAIPLGLGLALAQPDRGVIVVSGDGSLLMNLGCLVTAAASGARNLTVLLLDNGIYEVTGGQTTPGRVAPVDYAAMARAAGFPQASRIRTRDGWRNAAATLDSEPGPRFVSLEVAPCRGTPGGAADPAAEAVARFRRHLLA